MVRWGDGYSSCTHASLDVWGMAQGCCGTGENTIWIAAFFLGSIWFVMCEVQGGVVGDGGALCFKGGGAHAFLCLGWTARSW